MNPLRDISRHLVRREVLLVLVIIGGVWSVSLGARTISLGDILTGNPDVWRIVLLSRIPRLVSVLLAGAGLAVSGLILQSILRNRFASPGTAATIDGARVGFVLAVLLIPEAPTLIRIIAAAVTALAATSLFVFLIGKIRYRSVVVVPLLGLVLGNVLDAAAEAIAYHFDMIQSVSSWLVGDFSMIVQGRYEVLLISIPLVLLAFRYARIFTIAGLGKETAGSLGLNYGTTVVLAVLIVSSITAVAVVVGGEIPFIGLVVPNIIAIVHGDNLSRTIPETALLGAVFLLVSDILGRIIIHPYEIPIGLTMGVVGSAVFLLMVMQGRLDGSR